VKHLPPPPVGRLLGRVMQSIEPVAVFEMKSRASPHPMEDAARGIYATWPTQTMGSLSQTTIDEGEAFTPSN